jgi:predicted enzyme related to lactoylglutathione lyase
MGNPFVHVDLAASDRPAAKKFYKALFDWKLQDLPGMGGWTGIDVGGGAGGGISDKQSPDEPTEWTAFVEVASVKKTIAKAEKLGATILLPFMPIGDMGALGIFRDPQGAKLGVWEQNKKAPPPAAKKAAAKKSAAKKTVAKKPAAKKGAAKKK